MNVYEVNISVTTPARRNLELTLFVSDAALIGAQASIDGAVRTIKEQDFVLNSSGIDIFDISLAVYSSEDALDDWTHNDSIVSLSIEPAPKDATVNVATGALLSDIIEVIMAQAELSFD